MTRQDMFSWLLGKKQKASESEQTIRPVKSAPSTQDKPPVVADSSPNLALTSGAAETPAEPASDAEKQVAGPLIVLQKAVAPTPKAGMVISIRNGRTTQPAKIDLVYGSGRRLLVIAEGSEFRRAYTRRGDGRYHLEGAPDGVGPAIDFAITAGGKSTAHHKNQRFKPLRYVNLRRSPGFKVMQDGRRPVSERDNEEARGQGSATGRRPVIKGPIITPRRSKARSRMPRASKWAQVLTR